MALKDTGLEFDGQSNVLGGKNAGSPPSVLEENQFASAVNISIRGGHISTRPAFEKIPLEFEDSYDQRRFQDGLFQGAYVSDRIIYVGVGGIIFRILPDQVKRVENLSASNTNVKRFSSLVPTLFFERAGNYLVIQDTIHNPLIIGDNVVRHSNPQGEELWDAGLSQTYIGNHEIVPGGPMAFGQGRLFVAYPNSNAFYAADPEFPFDPLQVIRLTEQRQLSNGGPLFIPKKFGPIVALKFLQRLDTTTGDGPMLAFGKRGVVMFQFPPLRATWSSTTIGKYALLNDGAVSSRCNTEVNSDLFFRSVLGFRSFNISYQEFQKSFSNTPISQEIQDRIDEETPWMMRDSDAIVHKNRVLFATRPYRGQVARDDGKALIPETRFKGIVSLNMDALSNLRVKANPAYEDVWTGLNVVGMVSDIEDGDSKAYIFARDRANKLVMYRVNHQLHDDNGNQSISSKFVSRSYRFGSSFTLHDLASLELWLSEIRGDVSISAYYKPDGYNKWIPWQDSAKTLSVNTDLIDFSDNGCDLLNPGPGSFRRLTWSSPKEDDCGSMDKTSTFKSSQFQIKLEWTGHLKINRLRVIARPVKEEKVPGPCGPTQEESFSFDKSCATDYDYTIVG